MSSIFGKINRKFRSSIVQEFSDACMIGKLKMTSMKPTIIGIFLSG
jgi:hypothetical protein